MPTFIINIQLFVKPTTNNLKQHDIELTKIFKPQKALCTFFFIRVKERVCEQ